MLLPSVSATNLTVKSIYTTESDSDTSDGAMTLTCTDALGNTIYVRTIVLRDASGNKITEDYFRNKIIDVNGYVDYFNGKYQIKVFSIDDVMVR